MPGSESAQHRHVGAGPSGNRALIGVFSQEEIRQFGLSCVFEEEIVCGEVKLHPRAGPLHELLSNPEIRYLLFDLNDKKEKKSLLETIHRNRPDLRLIVIGPTDEELAMEALRLGAKAYIDYSASIEVVRKAIVAVVSGSVWASRSHLSKMQDHLLAAMASGGHGAAITLTARETQVLDLIMAARSNREIAEHLGIEERTVKAHVGRLMRKTGAENRVGLTLRALETPLSRLSGTAEGQAKSRKWADGKKSKSQLV